MENLKKKNLIFVFRLLNDFQIKIYYRRLARKKHSAIIKRNRNFISCDFEGERQIKRKKKRISAEITYINHFLKDIPVVMSK